MFFTLFTFSYPYQVWCQNCSLSESCCRLLQNSCFLGFRLGALSFEFLRQNTMIGFGSYGGNVHGGGSSNLSALAPPFTVDRSIQKPTATPLVDLGEPLNWLDTNPYTFNSPQPAQFPRLDLDPITTPSYNQNSDLFEPQTYYPSNVSPPLHVPSFNEHSSSGLDHTAQWGGGLWDWEKGKPVQLGGSFYSKDTNVAPSSIYTDHINLGKFSFFFRSYILLGKLVPEAFLWFTFVPIVFVSALYIVIAFPLLSFLSCLSHVQNFSDQMHFVYIIKYFNSGIPSAPRSTLLLSSWWLNISCLP